MRWQTRGQLSFDVVPGTVPQRWNVFEPLSRNTFRIGWLEHSMLRLLRFPNTLEGVVATVIASTAVERAEVVQALQVLQQHGLIYAVDSPSPWQPALPTASFANHDNRAEAASLLGKSTRGMWLRSVWREMSTSLGGAVRLGFKRLSALLAIQLRGPDPTRQLAWLAPRLEMLFSAVAVSRWLLLAAATTLLVLANLDLLSREVDSLVAILQPATGGSLLLLILLTRCIHELGHAVVATRHGIRCPDAGLYIFCGAPCLYCDVTESWLLTNRRQRAAVAAGGMYAELLIAILAAWVWLLTEPGQVHFIAMKLMLICSLGSLLVNLNPLLRFDGYYILADWLDEPNLRQRADREALAVIGLTNHPDGQSGRRSGASRRWFYIAFSFCSLLFRLTLSLGIAWAVAAYLERWNMALLGKGLAVGLLVSWWGGAVMKLVTRMTSDTKRRSRRLQGAWLVVCLWCLALIPLPVRRSADGWVEPVVFQGVYVPEESRLEESHVTDGDQVFVGQTLFSLHSQPLLVTRISAERELGDSQIVLRHAFYRQHTQPTHEADSANLGELQSRVAFARQELASVQRRVQALQVLAPAAGTFLAEPINEPTAPIADRPAPRWTDAAYTGRSIRKGQRLGVIVDKRYRGVVPIHADLLSNVAKGTRVKLRFQHDLTMVSQGRVVDVIAMEETELGEDSLHWRPVASTAIPEGSSGRALSGKPTATRYAAIVELSAERELQPGVVPGCKVTAVFAGEPASLLQRAIDWTGEHGRWLIE